MDIETRVTNLEKLVDSLVTTINNTKFYTDADINGVRQNVTQLDEKLDTAVDTYADKAEAADILLGDK